MQSLVVALSTTGPPTSGTWSTNQQVTDSAGVQWKCTAGGTPGTWAQSGAYASASQTGQFVGPNNGSNILSTQFPLRKVAAKIDAQQPGPAQVRWLTYGSSVAHMKLQEVGDYVAALFGGQNGAIIDSGASSSNGDASYTGITQNSTAGTWTDNTTDFAYWPSGLTTVLGAGASRTYGIGGGAAYCDHIEVYYIGGTGVFSVAVDAGAAVNVDTSLIAAGALGIYTVTPALGNHTVTVAYVSGSPKILGGTSGFGIGMWDSTHNGWTPIAVAQGGINLYAAGSQAFANFTTFLTHVAPDIITFEMKDGQVDNSYNTGPGNPAIPAFHSWLTAIDNAFPAEDGPDVLIIGSTPDHTTGALQQQCNQACAVACQSYQPAVNAFMWDGYTPLVNYATVLALGWEGDGTHLAWQAQRFLAMLLLRDIGLLGLRGTYFPLPVRNALTQTNELDIGQSGSTIPSQVPNLKVVPVGGTDAEMQVQRWLDLYDQAGHQLARLIAVSGSDPWMQDLTHVGASTHAGFSTDGSKELQIVMNGRKNPALGDYGYVAAGTVWNPNYLGATSGAITFDCNTGNILIQTLNGNATSSTIANTYTDGEVLVIGFRQDATGGRTYVWPTNVRFAGNAGPTDTTLNTETTVTLRFDSGQQRWKEIARSVAVPVT